MRRSTGPESAHGAGPAAEPSSSGISGGRPVDWREDRPERAGKKPQPSIERKAPPTQRPLLRGWVAVMSMPYSLVLAYHLVLSAPTLGSAKAAMLWSFCCVHGYAVHSYYHVVTHAPAWRACVRRYDHASIFLIIAGSFTPFVYRAYENTGQGWMLGLLVAEWVLALAGMATSISGLVSKMTKLQRSLMYIAVSCTPVPASGFAFGWDVYRWPALGGAVYASGGVMYAMQWPNPVPGVFGYHELMHLANVIAHTLFTRGLMQAYLQY